MKDFLSKSLDSMISAGFFATIIAAAVIGWNMGAEGDSSVLGGFIGLIVGFIGATIAFGTLNMVIGIHRNTRELLLVTRVGKERADELLRVADSMPGIVGAASSGQIVRFVTNGYLILFFAYMFLPLIFMIIAAFNSSTIPQLNPWKGTTVDWFGVLFADNILWGAVWNSVLIGIGVIILAIPLGLAGALFLTRVKIKGRTLIYGILVSPVLTPGVILGISTLVLWNNIGVPGGIFLTVIAQSTFIAAYAMLLFMARLQRFDPVLEEAALDLGASHQQVFWKVTVPFLRPTILTAGVLAFLQSFENYNTTLFTIGADTTMTVRIASMVRLGITPEINALAVLFIGLTVFIAVIYEIKRRAEKVRTEVQLELAKRADSKIVAGSLDAVAPAAAPA